MQVILKEDVVNLGYKDDIVTVKNGYGRNFLIPQGKAVIASESAKKVLAENLRQRAHKLAKIKEDAQAVAAKLEGVSLTIGAKTSSTGTIFGSVGNIQVAEALEKLGFEVDRKVIYIKEAVKEVGSYKAQVKLHKEVSVDIPFEVVSE
ncbi:50S ribosomal protein L9 [Parabacteroides sp. 52]|uniref:50S ribosomal protein L9 n=1 Tax=unclassified Parabacteroides TaxID=2649774 RepID=UPI0013D0953A|nr:MULTISPECIES: 50S ribosomal protein L9 [unclassified Parabacteroides]MDH6535033.1 large subunit ribosomal protein L9 [Parabacteroides sp. PM5-20]NDV55293.1 50S ribosomal protein L9 [Parabacteroides sp. 52]